MAKKNMLFCANCGERHNLKEKKCSKCGRKLPVKSRLIISYLEDHIKDDLKGKITDKTLSIIKNYLMSHLYGTVLTLTVVLTATTVVVAEVIDHNKYDYPEVSEKPTIAVKTDEPTEEPVEPEHQLSELEEATYAYWAMYENNDFSNRDSIYYLATDYYAPWDFNNGYHIFFADKEKLTIDKSGICRAVSILPADEYPAFNEMTEDGYILSECSHSLNYCTDDTCGTEENERPYDFSIDIIVGYVKVNGKWHALYDAIGQTSGDLNLFYEVSGNITEYVAKLN